MSKTIENKNIEKNIYNIIEDFEKKINKRPISNYRYQTKKINNENNMHNLSKLSKNNQLTKLFNPITNTNRSEAEIRDSLNDYKLRQIIKEEFASLIVPYHKYLLNSVTALESQIFKNNFEINQLKSKIYNDLFSMDNSQSIIDNNKYNKYILKNEYENKISEIDYQLSSILSFTKSLKEIIKNNNNLSSNILDKNKYVNKNEFEIKIKEIQNKINDINKYQNNMNLNLNNLNKNITEIKNNENRMNNLYNEIKSIKNEIISLNNKSQLNSNNMNKLIKDIHDIKQHVTFNDFNPDHNSISNLKKI